MASDFDKFDSEALNSDGWIDEMKRWMEVSWNY
jgi:hypothetical protein